MTVDLREAALRRSFHFKEQRSHVRIALPDSEPGPGRQIFLREEERDSVERMLAAPLLAHAEEVLRVGLFPLMYEDLEDVSVRHELCRHQPDRSNARGLEVEVGATHPSARQNDRGALLLDEHLGFDRNVFEAGDGSPEHMEELPVGGCLHQGRFDDGAHVDPRERGIDDSNRGAHRGQDDTRLRSADQRARSFGITDRSLSNR